MVGSIRCGNSVDASRDCQMMCVGSAAMDGNAMLMVDNAQSKPLNRYVYRACQRYWRCGEKGKSFRNLEFVGRREVISRGGP